jgi:ABC-type bacteriocin/lantibiotic exporter with double-glycine peptidase domain
LKIPQLVTIGLALLLCIVLVIFVPRENKKITGQAKESNVNQTFNTASSLEGAKTALSASQKQSLLAIEYQLNTSKSTQDSIKAFQKIARFWADSANSLTPYL